MAKIIRVHSRFELRKDYRSSKIFDIGLHEVSDEEANHWFVQGNSEILKELPNEIVAEHQKKRPYQKKNGTEVEVSAEDGGVNKNPSNVVSDVKPQEQVDDSYLGQIKKMVGY